MIQQQTRDTARPPAPIATDQPFVSVIIPVFNDAERLRLCLQALAQQTYPRDRYEVLVADNGSTEDIAAVVGAFAGMHYLREERPGSYAARNLALSVAKGSVIALTDADCLPEPNWLAAGVTRLQRTPNCGLVAGAVRLFYQDAARPTTAELYDSAMSFQQQKYTEKYHFGATANVFTFKHVFDTVGPFDLQLRSGGDREWGERVHAAGLQVVYADEVRIRHPARASMEEVVQRNKRLVAGSEHTRMKRPYPLIKFAKRIFKDVVPYRRLYWVWTNNRLHGARQRLIVTGVLLRLQLHAALIRLRVRLGIMSEIR